MIQEFSLKNFLSFNDRQTINFLASSDKSNLEYLTYQPKEGVRILKLMLIYGANASGKSNLLFAIETLWRLLISSENNENNLIDFYRPFELNKNEPTVFEIIFWFNKKKYHYKVEYDSNKILYEKLDYTSDFGIMSNLYEREFGKEIKFGSTIDIKSNVKKEFNLNTLKNHTVLSTLNKKNINSPKILIDLYEWIKENIHEVSSFNNPVKLAEYAINNPPIKLFLLDLLKRADFNIYDFDVIETKINDKIRNEILNDNSIPESLKERILKSSKTVIFKHKSDLGEYSISYEFESNGTQTYFRLARLLVELSSNSTIILEDELEENLHYDLLLHFLETYLRIEDNGQLIFSTHNQMLLEESWMLRRDLICLIEKSSDTSCSEIYKASDLSLHKNISLLNAYKIGKLGSKPNLGSTFINKFDYEKK